LAVIKSYQSFDWKPCTIVPVIASFDTEGHIRPLYVRINNASFRIESYWEKKSYANISEFMCHILDGDCMRAIALTYYHDSQTWTIPR